MKKAALIAAAVSIALSPVLNACSLNLVATSDRHGVKLSWSAPTPDSSMLYEIFDKNGEVSSGWRFAGTALTEEGKAGSYVIHPPSSVEALYDFLVVGRDQSDPTINCVGVAQRTVQANPDLAAISHRKIVPIVGSTHGANGSDFRTSLTLHHYPFTKGRIYFRPMNTTASDADPYITYEFGDNGTEPQRIHYEDVVSAMGATGVGSLEIIPDAGTREAVPEIEVRAYNWTPDGTFGTRVAAVRVGDWVRQPGPEPNVILALPAVEPNFRRNVGFRSTNGVTCRISILRPGQPMQTLPLRSSPRNFTWFGSLDQLVGEPVSHDTRVIVSFFGGYVVAFRTETENSTNDPTVVIADPSKSEHELAWHFY